MSLIKKAFDLYCKINRILNGFFLPRLIVFEPTQLCNLRCKMCTYYGKEGIPPNYGSQLGLEQIAKMFHNISSSYKLIKPIIGITGGEPFMRKDIINILRIIKMEGLDCSITTNAALITESQIKTIAKEKLVIQMNISIDGIDETHDEIRGVKGTYEKALNSIKLIGRYNIPYLINTVILKDNLDELKKLNDIFKEHHRIQHQIFSTPEWNKAHSELTKQDLGYACPVWNNKPPFEKEQTATLYDTLYKRKIEQEPEIHNNLYQYYFDLNWTRSKYCYSVFGSLRITQDGSVYPCFDFKLGNIVNNNLREIWKGKEAKLFLSKIKERKLYPGCRRCCKL